MAGRRALWGWWSRAVLREEMSSLLIVLLPLVQFGGFSTNRDFSHFGEAAPAGQIHQFDLQLNCISLN